MMQSCVVCVCAHSMREFNIFDGVGCDYNSNNGKTSYYLIHHLKIICGQQCNEHGRMLCERERWRKSRRKKIDTAPNE